MGGKEIKINTAPAVTEGMLWWSFGCSEMLLDFAGYDRIKTGQNRIFQLEGPTAFTWYNCLTSSGLIKLKQVVKDSVQMLLK